MSLCNLSTLCQHLVHRGIVVFSQNPPHGPCFIPHIDTQGQASDGDTSHQKDKHRQTRQVSAIAEHSLYNCRCTKCHRNQGPRYCRDNGRQQSRANPFRPADPDYIFIVFKGIKDADHFGAPVCFHNPKVIPDQSNLYGCSQHDHNPISCQGASRQKRYKGGRDTNCSSQAGNGRTHKRCNPRQKACNNRQAYNCSCCCIEKQVVQDFHTNHAAMVIVLPHITFCGFFDFSPIHSNLLIYQWKCSPHSGTNMSLVLPILSLSPAFSCTAFKISWSLR